MYQIAIVEDEKVYADLLNEYLEKFAKEKELEFHIRRFTNAISLLENYRADYDLIFMDIRMPYLNGIDAAHKLRELDNQVLLIFITSLAQYAIKGYEVDAFDYILKPVAFYDFSLKLSRAMRKITPKELRPEILLTTTEGKIRIPLDSIRYVETSGHHLIYHVENGKTYSQYASLSSASESLEPYSFSRCNSCYLVNLKYVQKIKGYSVTVDGIELQISQPRKKEFLNSLIIYAERTRV